MGVAEVFIIGIVSWTAFLLLVQQLDNLRKRRRRNRR